MLSDLIEAGYGRPFVEGESTLPLFKLREHIYFSRL